MFILMIKTHNKTGLKYLCQTKRKDPFKYVGSGKYWKQHLKKHGYDIKTEILGIFETDNELKEEGKRVSELYNVVESNEWANLRPEDGTGGRTADTPGYKKGMKNRRSYKGEGNPNYGKVGSWAGKVGPMIDKIWCNNGVEEKLVDVIEEGWTAGRMKYICQHCKIETNNINFKRWHGDKCKKNTRRVKC